MPRKKRLSSEEIREHLLKTMLPLEEYNPDKHDCDPVIYENLKRMKDQYDKEKEIEAVYDARQTLHERTRVLARFVNKHGSRYKLRVKYCIGYKGYAYDGFIWMTRQGYLIVDLSPAYRGVRVYVRTDGSMAEVDWKNSRNDGVPKTYPNINWWFPKDNPPDPWINLSPPKRSYL